MNGVYGDWLNLFWCYHLSGHAAISKALEPYGIGVATGEHCQNRVIFKQFFQAKGFQFCQIDSCRMGGLNEVLAVLLMAAKFGGKAWGFMFNNPLTPKNYRPLISLYSITLESKVKVMMMKKIIINLRSSDSQPNSPHQYHRNYQEKWGEYTNIRLYNSSEPHRQVILSLGWVLVLCWVLCKTLYSWQTVRKPRTKCLG